MVIRRFSHDENKQKLLLEKKRRKNTKNFEEKEYELFSLKFFIKSVSSLFHLMNFQVKKKVFLKFFLFLLRNTMFSPT